MSDQGVGIGCCGDAAAAGGIRKNNGKWIKTAVISYPLSSYHFEGDSMFQEDFTFNNLGRACKLRNAYGRRAGSSKWVSWKKFYVSNAYLPTDPPTWDSAMWNISFDTNWALRDHKTAVWVQSGGSDFTKNQKTIPITYTVKQPSKPQYPGWIKTGD